MKRLLLCAVLVSWFVTVLAADTYFPKDSISAFEQGWYAKHLAAMKEPVLKAEGKPSGYIAVRFLYLPTWGRPVTFRAEGQGGMWTQRAVRLSGDGGYDPGTIALQKETRPTEFEMTDFLRRVEQAGLWKLPAKDRIIGPDGTQLVIEAIRDGKHHVWVRWTPEHQSDERGLSELVSFYTNLFRETSLLDKDN